MCVMSGLVLACACMSVANIEILCCLASMEKNIVLFVMSIELLCCPWRV